jgi:hypothetical protein
VSLSESNNWSKPRALAIPREGYFEFEQGKYGPVFPRTPACHGFTIIARIKPGREQVIREYGISDEVRGAWVKLDLYYVADRYPKQQPSVPPWIPRVG